MGVSDMCKAEDRRRWVSSSERIPDFRRYGGRDGPLPIGRKDAGRTQRLVRQTAANLADSRERERLEVVSRVGHCDGRGSFSEDGGLGDDFCVKKDEVTEEGFSLYRVEDFWCEMKGKAELDGQMEGSTLVGLLSDQCGPVTSVGPNLQHGLAVLQPKKGMVDSGKMEGSILGPGPGPNLLSRRPSPQSQGDSGPSANRAREPAKTSSSTSSFLAKYGNRNGGSTLRRMDPSCFGSYRDRDKADSLCSSEDDVSTNFTDGIVSEMGDSTVFGDDCDPYGIGFGDNVLRGDGSSLAFDDSDSSQQGKGEALDLALCEDGLLERLFEESPLVPKAATNPQCLGVKERMNKVPHSQLRTYCRRKEPSLMGGKNKFKAKNNGFLSKMGISVIPLKKSLSFGMGGPGSVCKVQGGGGGV